MTASSSVGPGLLLAAVAGVVAVFLAKGAVGFASTALAIRRTQRTDAGAVSAGLIAVVGRVDPAGETLESPLGRECVAYRIETRGSEGAVSDQSEVVPFRVVDDSGGVLVDATPRDADLSETEGRSLFQRLRRNGGATTSITWGDRETATATDAEGYPPGVAGALDASVREGRLEPGQEVYVLGTATERSLHGQAPAVVNRTDRPFAVSVVRGDEDVGRTASRGHLWVAVLAGVGALAFAGAAAFRVLSALG